MIVAVDFDGTPGPTRLKCMHTSILMMPAYGVPLIKPDDRRPYVDWSKVEIEEYT